MRILAGDVGGTKTALGLYEQASSGKFRALAQGVYASGEHESLEAVLRKFLGNEPAHIDSAAFGVAGPVNNGICAATNLPWVVDERLLAAELNAKASVINDFHAIALGVSELPTSQLRILQSGRVEPGEPFAIIGAGTGLGEAIGVPTARGMRILASEGGHVDFAPRNDVEIRLLKFLMTRHDRVSAERVVSGPGLEAIYDFVVADGLAPDDPVTRGRFTTASAGAVISERARGKQDPAAALAIELFVSAYGAEAGNLALKVLPKGGLYVAGGIAAKLNDELATGAFVTAFLTKGRMSKLLEAIRVAIVLDQTVGLLGARARAAVL